MGPPRRANVCVCADDYAMTPGVSRGILAALEAGALTATSAMTTSQWWPEWAAALKPFEADASIGLHLNLTLGAPLGAMPAFSPQNTLPSIGEIMRLARTRMLPLEEIGAEIERQLQAFHDAYGRPPDHVDGHQHVHVLKPIRTLMLAALVRRGWRPWLRNSGDQPDRILRRRECLQKALGLAFLSRGFAAEAKQAGFATNEGFSGFSSFDITTPYQDSFQSYLKSLGARHLIMCHPGIVDDALRRLDPVVETREMELRFLLSPAFRSSLEHANARLARLP